MLSEQPRFDVNALTDEDLDRIDDLLEKATPGDWTYGGPVKRESLLWTPSGGTGPNGLTREVYEVAHEGDLSAPALCVVNEYCSVSLDGTTPARHNAAFIAASRTIVEDLLAEVRRLRAKLRRLQPDAEA
jgi:hypothetical protein